MTKNRKLFLRLIIISIVGVLSVSAHVYAFDLPWLDYTGDFSYVYCTSYKGGGACSSGTKVQRLTFSYDSIPGLDITAVNYIGDTSATYSGDAILSASIYIGTLYNSDPTGNLHFDSVAGAGGGSVTFSIRDATYTYLTATLSAMDLYNYDPTYILSNIDNISNITFNPNGNAPYSRYIAELQQTVDSNMDGYGDYSMDFGMGFSRYTGTAGFTTNNSSGSVSGKLQGGPLTVVPEPVSSLLFVAGGATLAVRRYWKKKKRNL